MTDTPETHDGTVTPTTSVLTPYRGQPVMAAGIAIPNASGGLQAALAVDPVELEIGSIVHVVLQCEVRPPQYDPIDKDNNRGPLRLVNRLHALEGTFVDAAIVKAQLDAQRERVEQAKSIEEQRKREEAGEVPLFDPDDDRGGEPDTVGSVLDDALGLAEDAETTTTARIERLAELKELSRDDVRELARTLEVEGRSTMTRTELEAAIVDAEHEGGDA